jgi:hypothetical protein
MSDAHSEHATLLDDTEHRPVGATETLRRSPEDRAIEMAPTSKSVRNRSLPPIESGQGYATPSRWFG